MFGNIAIVAFAIALLMHLFGWSAGKIDVLLFVLIGLLCVAIHIARRWGWPGRQRRSE